MNLISNRKAFRRCAFAIFLLLSVFTFSGFAIQVHSEATRAPISLVVNSRARHSKDISYYAKAHTGCKIVQHLHSSIAGLDRLHTRIVKTLLSTINSVIIPRRASLVYYVKSLTQNTADETAIS